MGRIPTHLGKAQLVKLVERKIKAAQDAMDKGQALTWEVTEALEALHENGHYGAEPFAASKHHAAKAREQMIAASQSIGKA
jgi:hypothetical protein